MGGLGNFGVTEGALVLLVLDRVVSIVRTVKNGNGGLNGSKLIDSKLDRLISLSDTQVSLLSRLVGRGEK